MGPLKSNISIKSKKLFFRHFENYLFLRVITALIRHTRPSKQILNLKSCFSIYLKISHVIKYTNAENIIVLYEPSGAREGGIESCIF